MHKACGSLQREARSLASSIASLRSISAPREKVNGMSPIEAFLCPRNQAYRQAHRHFPVYASNGF